MAIFVQGYRQINAFIKRRLNPGIAGLSVSNVDKTDLAFQKRARFNHKKDNCALMGRTPLIPGLKYAQ